MRCPRSAAHSRDAVDLQTVVALHFTTNIDELIFGEVGTDLENAPGALLTEVSIADRDMERIAHHVDPKGHTHTDRSWSACGEYARSGSTLHLLSTSTPACHLATQRLP
jgi:hypothetical protein